MQHHQRVGVRSYDAFVGESGVADWPEGELVAAGHELNYPPGTWLILEGEFERVYGRHKRLHLHHVKVVQDVATRVGTIWDSLQQRPNETDSETLRTLLRWHAQSDMPTVRVVAIMVALDEGDDSRLEDALEILDRVDAPLLQSLWQRLTIDQRRALSGEHLGVFAETMSRLRRGWSTPHRAVQYLPYTEPHPPHFGGPAPTNVDPTRVYAWLRERVWEVATPSEQLLLETFARLTPEQKRETFMAQAQKDEHTSALSREHAIEDWFEQNADSQFSPPDELGYLEGQLSESFPYRWCRHCGDTHHWGVVPWLAGEYKLRGGDSDRLLRSFDAVLILSEVAPGLVRSVRDVVHVETGPLRCRVWVELQAGKGILLTAEGGDLGQWQTKFGRLDALRA